MTPGAVDSYLPWLLFCSLLSPSSVYICLTPVQTSSKDKLLVNSQNTSRCFPSILQIKPLFFFFQSTSEVYLGCDAGSLRKALSDSTLKSGHQFRERVRARERGPWCSRSEMGSFSVCFGMLRGLVEFSHPSVKMAVTITLFGD